MVKPDPSNIVHVRFKKSSEQSTIPHARKMSGKERIMFCVLALYIVTVVVAVVALAIHLLWLATSWL